MPKTSKPKEVEFSAAQMKRIHTSASKLVSEAIEMMASSPLGGPDDIRSAGIPSPVTGGRSMIDAQKFRVNWYQVDRKPLGRIARLVTERNWFARPVHELNKRIYSAGFAFADPAAISWAAAGSYPFRQLQNDMIDEWLVSDAVCVFWSTEAEVGKLPMIEVPDMEDVDYKVVGGIPQITVTVGRDAKIGEDLKSRIGNEMWECIRKGRRLTIIQGGDSGYDFMVMKSGKSTGCLPVPRLTGILDDLDYIEAVRTGDWNGAYSRREVMRHTTKGYGVSSGPNAGTTRNNAKFAEINAILKAMKSIMGKTDLATNFDQEVKWILFPSEFFSPQMLESAHQRLIFWGGLAAILLLKTDSQITGLSSMLYDRMRAQVSGFRDEFAPFLAAVFNAPSFRKNFPDAPDLSVKWSVNQLYSGDGFNKLTTLFATYGVTSPQTIREMFGIDNELESGRMKDAHTDAKAYTPPYEPRQGIASAFTHEKLDAGGGGSQPSSLPGDPGRPAAE